MYGKALGAKEMGSLKDHAKEGAGIFEGYFET